MPRLSERPGAGFRRTWTNTDFLRASIANAALAVSLTGCGGTGRTIETDVATGRTIHAIPGQPLVLPAGALRQPGDARVSIGSRPVEAFASAIDASAELDGPDQWLAIGRWRNDPDGSPILVVNTPGTPVGESITIDGDTSPLNWVEPAYGGDQPDGLYRDPINSRWFDRLTESIVANPLERWRERLMRGTLFDAPTTAAAKGNPLERLARQEESLWRAAFVRLDAIDPTLPAQVASRLGCSIAFGNHAIPFWVAGRDDALELRDLLLDPNWTDADLAIRVNGWLDAQPDNLVWVADDGLGIDSFAGVPIAGIGVMHFGAEPEAAVAGLPSDSLSRMGLVNEGRVTWLQAVSAGARDATTSDGVDDGSSVSVSVGYDRYRRFLFGRPLSVRPPGLRMGPFVAAWTRDALVTHAQSPEPSDVPLAPPPEQRTAVLLVREAPKTTSDVDRWMLFIECAGPAPTRQRADKVRVWLGPRGAPFQVLQVDRAGGAVRLPVRGGAGAPIASSGQNTIDVRVTNEPARWTAWLQVPPECIVDGRVQIGMERFNDLGVRTSWPRPMFPWQTEPARAVIDVTGWTDPQN